MKTLNKSKAVYFATILSILNCVAIITVSLYLFLPRNNGEGIIKYENDESITYVLYIGTNDKDTYTQLISTDEAKTLANAIIAKHIGGYTVQIAEGGWTDEKDVLTQETTLVYTISGADETQIIQVMDEILMELNQNSIMIEKQNRSYAFYY